MQGAHTCNGLPGLRYSRVHGLGPRSGIQPQKQQLSTHMITNHQRLGFLVASCGGLGTQDLGFRLGVALVAGWLTVAGGSVCLQRRDVWHALMHAQMCGVCRAWDM